MSDSKCVTWTCTSSRTPLPDSSASSMLGCGRGKNRRAPIREVEPAGVESHARGKDQTDVWSEESDSRPVNVEAGCAEGEDEDKELYIFPQCAPAPAPAVIPNGRAATATVDSSGYVGRQSRVTSTTNNSGCFWWKGHTSNRRIYKRRVWAGRV